MNRILLRGIPSLLLLALLPCEAAAQEARALTLQESLAIALQQSMVIQAAREGVKGAEALKKEALTGFLPKLSTSYNYMRVSPTPWLNTSALGSSSSGTSNTLAIGTKDNFTWYLEVRQPLFAGGSISANYEANKKGEEIARTEEGQVVQDIVQEVKGAYFSVLKSEKNLDVARTAVAELTAHRDNARHFFDAGVIPKNDLLQSEVRLARGEHDLVQAENALEVARSRFNTVLRRNINDPVRLEDILRYRPYDKTLDACLRTALEQRPELKAYALRIEQMREYVKAAKGDFLPSLNAIGHYERFGDTGNLDGTPYRSMENWYVMARADWNFWEWGKTKNQVAARRSKENQLSSLMASEQDRIALEVKAAFLKVRESEKQVFVAQRSIEQAEENFRINRERYNEQVATSTDVLDAQTLLTRTRSDYVNALGDYFINWSRLERAMGIIR